MTWCFKNCFQKAAATGEFIGNKIVDKIVKPKLIPDKNLREVKEITYPLEKNEEILNESWIVS